jgi:hypothetical protein
MTAATTPRHCPKRFARSSDVARRREKLHRRLLQPLPKKEALEALVRHDHHLQDEHERAFPGRSTGQRLEESRG